MSVTHPALSRAELEAFDPGAPPGGARRRFLCPLCGPEKPRDAAHRSLSLEVATGRWRCFRCQAGGTLRDFWDGGGRSGGQERFASSKSKRTNPTGSYSYSYSSFPSSDLPGEPPPEAAPEPAADWREPLKGVQHLAGSPGERYLAGRGILLEVAVAARVKYHPEFFGRPAVLFPVQDRAGAILAAQGRYLDGRTDPKVRTTGPAGGGVFLTPGAWQADPLILVEAPIDALSLAACGYPAIATLGCRLPDWLPEETAFCHVQIAPDADREGDKAALSWAVSLTALGARVTHLRPAGAKDWNELLQRHSAAALRAALERVLW